jgi:3-dehydroquinate dehydratase / shikimate dehydrogenase
MLSALADCASVSTSRDGFVREQDSTMPNVVDGGVEGRVEPAAMRPSDRVFAIFGGSGRSLSPQIHNGGYRAYGLSASYISIVAREGEPFDLGELLAGTLDGRATPWAGRLGGLTVVSPHKERAIEVATEVSDIARRSGAANLLVRTPVGWLADTTDACGVLEPLRRRGTSLAGRRTLVVGCGGAGRAAAVGLADAGAQVTLVNRRADRGEFAARQLGLPWVALDEIELGGCQLIVNATPLGQDGEHPPFSIADLPRGAIVVDFVYADRVTPLVAQARAGGHEVVDGREILVVQVAAQFERMTGVTLDEDLAWQLPGWADARPLAVGGV